MATDEEKNGKTHSAFDLNNQLDEDDEKPKYKTSGLEKWINWILCRGDLAKEAFESPPVSFVQLFRFGTKKDKILVLVGILLGIFAGIAQPFSTYIGGKIANVLISYGKDGDREKLVNDGYKLIAVDLGIGLVVVIVTFIQYFCLRLACRNIVATLRYKFIQSILRQDAAWFDKQKFGAINSQLQDGIKKIEDGIGDKVGLLTRGITMFLTTIVISFFVNWKISLLMILTGPACCLTMSFMARMVSRSSKKQMYSYEMAGAILQESIMNVKTVQSCNGQEQMAKKLEDQQNASRIHGVLIYVWNGLFDGIFFFFLYFFYAIGIYYGGTMYLNLEVEAGDVFIVVNAITMGGYFLGVMSPHIMRILQARVAAAVIYNKIDRVPYIDCMSTEGKPIKNSRGLVEFKNVKFCYPSRPGKFVLNDVSWDALPGETVALVGHSGCGKSTSMGLITHLYECNDGQVCIDGEDVRQLNISQLRKIIGVVSQEPVLFNGTIFENIALGDPNITLENIITACKLSNSYDFIMQLENGFDTLIGAGGGVQLSGGQKQRVSIARAIIRNPPILLLDEATSALDAESEILVQNALREASKNRTTIVIAHRLSTLREAKKIIVLNNGQVVETGSHEDLVANGELYASLVKAQQFQSQQDSSTKKEEKPIPEAIDFHRANLNDSFTSTMTRSSIRDHTALEYKIDEESNENLDRFFSGGLLLLYRNCKGHYWKLFGGTVFSLLRGLELPLYVLLMNMAFVTFEEVNNYTHQEYKDRLFWFVIFSCLIGLYSTITIFGAVSLYGWLTEEISDLLKLRALRNILRQGAEYFDRPATSNANLLKRISNDTTTLKAALDIRLYHLVNNVFCCFIEVLVAFVFAWEVTMVGLGLYLILFLLLWFLAKQMRKNIHKIADVDDSANYSVEIIENTRTIQLLSKESYFLEKFNKRLQSFRGYSKNVGFYDALMFAFTQNFFFFSDTACYGIGLYLIYSGTRNPSEVFISSQTLATLSWAILFVSTSFNEILHAVPAIGSVMDIVSAPTCIDGHEIDGIEPDISGDVSAEKLVFAYPARPQVNVANGLILRAKKGETIALVGPSGGGKSTIINLLERFYEPKSGQITIDRSPIRRFKLNYLRSKLALVGQEPVLFSGSIFENITLGAKNVTEEDVIEAARISNAHNFILNLPQGYQTEIGEKGATLSGGQKQRIALARALVRNPSILLLDEATSALDAESERLVQQGLDAASCNRTCIVIAHRLSSVISKLGVEKNSTQKNSTHITQGSFFIEIQYADKIYFISNGRVVESGNHDELMADNSLYAEMIKKQDLRS